MKLLFALLTISTLAAAQTRPGLAPTRPLANPLGSTAAISGQSRPLGGIPANNFGNNSFTSGIPPAGYPRTGIPPSGIPPVGYRDYYGGGNSYGKYKDRGNRNGYGVWGFSTFIPNYWGFAGDQASGPYSATYPDYSTPPPEPVPPPPSSSQAPVIINNYYGIPPPGANGADQPEHPGDPLTQPENYYLIVYKDHSVHAALAYWVEGNTLHYVTLDNAHNQVSIDLVDIAESTKLNSDHNVPFSIAGKSK